LFDGLATSAPAAPVEVTSAPAPGQPEQPAVAYRPTSQADLAPVGERAKLEANLTALRTLAALQEAGRPATAGEQSVLARWSGWGALPHVFDPAHPEHAGVRTELQALLGQAGYRAASRTTLNAHYTDAALVQAIWDTLGQAGFGGTAGRVLEPGCGAGTFLGVAPQTATQLVGVELDPASAAIAAALYPHAQVRAESFGDTRLPAGSVDLVVGNVPFGKIALHDPVHNPNRQSLHNHFILKSLALTRPGGVVAVLTSHWTLDATNPAARREIAALGQLVAAIRLPNTVHERAAGTRVLTDLLVLRRHHPDDHQRLISGVDPTGHVAPEPQWPGWERAVPVDLEQYPDIRSQPGRQGPAVNEVFGAHPEWVLGQTTVRNGQFGPTIEVLDTTGPAGTAGDDVVVTGVPAVADLLRARLGAALTGAAADLPGGTLFGPAPEDGTTGPLLRAPAPVDHVHGHIAVDPAKAGAFTVVEDGVLRPQTDVPATQAKELTALLGLRDLTMRLLTAEAASAQDSRDLAILRGQLNTAYDSYATRWGPINRVTTRRTGKTDPETGKESLARVRPPQGKFRADPHSPAVYALEDYDATNNTANKAPILRGRVVAPRPVRLGADTPADALAICLDIYGEVRLAEVARLLGADEPTARADLGALVFDEPEPHRQGAEAIDQDAGQDVDQGAEGPGPGRLVAAAEYLSGNVREKLRAAEQAAEQVEGVDWRVNVEALRTVVPVDLSPAEIDGRLGASWIGAADVAQFLRETLDDTSIKVENPGGSTWAVQGARYTVLACSTWGTGRANAIDLVLAVLEQKPIKVTDEIEGGRRVVNLTETVAAQEKAAGLGERFTEWLWEDPERATRLSAHYNDTFNAIVLRSYAAEGQAMQLPGLAVTFVPRPHQRAAVARIVSEPAVLLGHEVGAGKTAEMICGAMELRRLGMARKPAVVVPNHMLEQFTREWLQTYPQARVLAAGTEDLAGDKRRLLVARVATGDWDAVILSRSAFERIPLAKQAKQAYLDRQNDQLRDQIANSRAGSGLTTKKLERALASAEQRVQALLDSVKDVGVSFEQTGVDYLFVDEAHGYKNLMLTSNIPGVGVEGSQRASDLDMKMDYLRGKHGHRVATFATATPIANSVSEAYTMARYLRPDVLDAAGITDFDSWAATFGEVTTALELAPDGSNFRMQSRFAKFRNVPELLRMWHVSADIKTAADLDLPTPDLLGGAAETVVVPPSAGLGLLMKELSGRAERVQGRQVDPAEDNMLRIATHGRMGALDLRLLDRTEGEPTKLTVAADRIASIHHTHADRRYPGGDLPGSLQLVFCDLGTPNKGPQVWNVYDQLRELLADRGVGRAGVRFVHEAKNDRAKGELFAACRTGQVSILVGSTEKMGVGTNVQARAVALHHLDCPWRPADLAQREGRILRQGNQNQAVEIIRYVSEASFDAYLWQTVERKARFIAQVMRGTLDVREIEDIGDTALSYSEVKALATGDPRILDKARADTDLARLERLERAHNTAGRSLGQTVDAADRLLPRLGSELRQVDAALPRAIDTRGEAFAITLAGRRYTSRGDAAAALRDVLVALPLPPAGAGSALAEPQPIGQVGGFTVLARTQRYPQQRLHLSLDGVPRSGTAVEYGELRADRPVGLVTRLENRSASLPKTRSDLTEEITRNTRERERASAALLTPFQHTDALREARALSQRLADALAKELDNKRDTGEQLDDVVPAAEAAHGPVARGGPDNSRPSAAGVAATTAQVQAAPAQTQHVQAAPAQVLHSTQQQQETRHGRWQHLCGQLDARLPADPHWPVLAGALDRVDAAGLDVSATLAPLFPLSEDNPGRNLHHRLMGVAREATVERPRFRPGAPEAPAHRTAETPPAASRPVTRPIGR